MTTVQPAGRAIDVRDAAMPASVFVADCCSVAVSADGCKRGLVRPWLTSSPLASPLGRRVRLIAHDDSLWNESNQLQSQLSSEHVGETSVPFLLVGAEVPPENCLCLLSIKRDDFCPPPKADMLRQPCGHIPVDDANGANRLPFQG